MKPGDIIGIITGILIFGPIFLGLSIALCIVVIKALRWMWNNFNL